MQQSRTHPDTSDFQQVSEQFSLINLNVVQRQSSIQRMSILNIQPQFDQPILSQQLRGLIDKNIEILTESVDSLNQFANYIKYSQKWAVQQNYCMVFKKTHFIRLEQLFMLINIFMRYKDKEFMNNLREIYASIKGFEIGPSKIQEINVEMIQSILKIQRNYLISFKELVAQVAEFFQKDKFDEATDGILGLKVIHSKIYTICEVFPSACLFPINDILNPSKKKTQRWLKLNQHITYRCYGSPQAVHNSFVKLKQQVIWANAAMNTMEEANKLKLYKPEEMVEYLKKGLGLIGLLFLKEDAKRQAQRFQSQPDSALTKKIFNMTDEGITKQMLKVILPKIQFHQKIFIPRLLNYVNMKSLPDIFSKDHNLESKIKLNSHISHISEYRNRLIKDNPLCLTMRINCSTQIQYKTNKQPTFLEKINGLFAKQPIIHNSVVLHIHGGGFISMSSYSHQLYTRKWANQIKVPFVSVDYAKAPQYPYPAALNDCLQAYLWILNVMPQIYQIKPIKIYLVGDSAGGNLVAALTLLLIKLNLKIPDGIFMIYPALNINSKLFTPSLLHSLQDFILPHTYLKICARSYVQQYLSQTDYLLSPILAPAFILNKFPKTRIYVGSEDPFHDDCIRLTEKLYDCKVDVHLTVYESFSHGFLQFDNMIQPIYEARKAIDEIGKQMKKIIQANIA